LWTREVRYRVTLTAHATPLPATSRCREMGRGVS